MSTTNNLIVVSDIHAGCRLGLCPPDPQPLDDGGVYEPSDFQREMYRLWRSFWDEWVPLVTRDEPYDVVMNGDAVEGVHHRATTPISHNFSDQAKIAVAILGPIAEACRAKGGDFYFIRGTEAHVGASATHEEMLAKILQAKPNNLGQYSRWDLWKRVGKALVHLMHHIGTTSSSAHESSAVNAELTAEYVEAARWRQEPPDYVVRCLSDDTELLTRGGWRGHADVHVGDEVLTFNAFTEELQWQRAEEKVVNESEPALLYMRGKGMDLAVTPDHTMVVRTAQHTIRGQRPGGWYPMSAAELLPKARRGRAAQIEIPVSGWFRGQTVDLTMAELWLTGFFMADGCYVRPRAGGVPYAVRFAQADERAADVEDRLGAAGCHAFTRSVHAKDGTSHWDSRTSRWIYTRRNYSSWYVPQHQSGFLMANLDDRKCLLPHMLQMNADQFASLLAGFHYGDGSTVATTLHHSNERMLDQFQELFVKHGYKSSLHYHDCYTTKRGERKRTGVLHYVPNQRTVCVGQKHAGLMEIRPYGGRSWCVTVPNQTLVVRRHGAVSIVGNSHRHRAIMVELDSATGYAAGIVTPCWQGKTALGWRVAGARISQPQLGGILIRQGDEEHYCRRKVWSLGRTEEE